MLPHEHWSCSVHFSLTAAYAALRLKWRGKCVNSLSMCGCRPLAAGFHKCLAYVGAALRLSGGETVKIDIGWQRGCGWSQIFLVCLGGRLLPQFAQSAPLLCPRERKKGNLCPTQRMSFEMHMLLLFYTPWCFVSFTFLKIWPAFSWFTTTIITFNGGKYIASSK